MRRVLFSTALIVASLSCVQRDAHSDTPVVATARTITVWPDTITLWRGDTLRFRAIGIAETDVVLDDGKVSWSTSDSSIVTIAEGLATAKRRGSATIIAISEGKSGSARVNVHSGGGSSQRVPSNREAK